MEDRSKVVEALAAIDALIRGGEGGLARQEIRKLQRSGLVPPPLRERLAALARRAGIANVGVRLLHPIVHPSGRKRVEAGEKDWAEYAACLIRIGAVEEAMEILSSLDEKAHPDILLFRAFGEVAQWNYDASVAPLERYIAAPGADPYLRLVAQTNLLAAFVEQGRHAEATTLVPILFEATASRGLKLLRGNVLDYAAQNAIAQRAWGEAKELLTRAEKELSDFGASDALFVAKWKAVVAVAEESASPASLAALESVRQQAIERRHWETVRSCDYHRAIETRNLPLLRYVYFGTSFPAFRKRIEREWGDVTAIGSTFDWQLEIRGKKDQRLDLVTPSEREKKIRGDLVHDLLLALTGDFYRPARLASLHSKLYPSEPFNPISSGHRVFRLVQRLRSWFRESGYPLNIAEENGGYRLSPSGRISIRVSAQLFLGKDRSDHFIDEIRSLYPASAFRAEDAARHLGLSPRTVLNRLKDGVERGQLQREGRARACRYRLVSPPPK